MDPLKLTKGLTEKLDRYHKSDHVEVVVELHPGDSGVRADALTRRQRIASGKAHFERRATPVEQAIKNAGGLVVDRVWLNQSLRVRLPVDAVGALSDLEEVASLDVSRPIGTEDN